MVVGLRGHKDLQGSRRRPQVTLPAPLGDASGGVVRCSSPVCIATSAPQILLPVVVQGPQSQQDLWQRGRRLQKHVRRGAPRQGDTILIGAHARTGGRGGAAALGGGRGGARGGRGRGGGGNAGRLRLRRARQRRPGRQVDVGAGPSDAQGLRVVRARGVLLAIVVPQRYLRMPEGLGYRVSKGPSAQEIFFRKKAPLVLATVLLLLLLLQRCPCLASDACQHGPGGTTLHSSTSPGRVACRPHCCSEDLSFQDAGSSRPGADMWRTCLAEAESKMRASHLPLRSCQRTPLYLDEPLHHGTPSYEVI